MPVSNVSLVDLVVQCQKNVEPRFLKETLHQYAQGKFQGILSIEEAPLVSCDFIGSPFSAVLDQALTHTHGSTVQLFAWYDNEAGYCHRLLDLMNYIWKKQG